MPTGRGVTSHHKRFRSSQGGVLPLYSRTECSPQDPPYIYQEETSGAALGWQLPLSACLDYRESHGYALGTVTFRKIGRDVVPFNRGIQRVANYPEGCISVRSSEVDRHRRGIELMGLISEDVHHRL